MDGGTVFTNNKKHNICKLQVTEIVESHNRIRPEGTQYIRKKNHVGDPAVNVSGSPTTTTDNRYFLYSVLICPSPPHI